jgi:acyl-coenzyme A synthetase/AMP-(fatty) acid ligase
MRLGAISVSLMSRFQKEIEDLPNLSFLVCPEGDLPACPRAVQLIEIRSDWLKAASNYNVSLPSVEEAERHFGRICFTSGTSGKPKAILLDSEILKRRLSGTASRSRLHAQSVLWCGLGPDTAYGFTATLATWMAGGSVYFLTRSDHAYADLIESNVNVLIASPAALNVVLQSRPVDASSSVSGPVIVAGGPLSIRLRDLLLNHLCSEVLIAYGSSETGGVTLADAQVLDEHPGSVGSVFPDVQVQLVDDGGRILPIGTPGKIRIKADSSASSYLNDRVATAQHFSEGWFYPGDIARLSNDGTLTLLGREAETLNIGGVKFSASEIDGVARAQAGIEDACAIVLPDSSRGGRLAIAVVGQPDTIASFPPRLRLVMPELPPFSVVPVSVIPRNSMGKINREEFAQEIVELLQNSTAAAAGNRFSIIQAG